MLITTKPHSDVPIPMCQIIESEIITAIKLDAVFLGKEAYLVQLVSVAGFIALLSRPHDFSSLVSVTRDLFSWSFWVRSPRFCIIRTMEMKQSYWLWKTQDSGFVYIYLFFQSQYDHFISIVRMMQNLYRDHKNVRRCFCPKIFILL